MTGSRPTLEHVAKQAKVSTATVSRCFNAPERVRPALRQRVRDAVEALGYTPHGAARALASHRSNTIGAVVPTLDNAIFATVIETLQQQLSAAGRTLLVASSNYDPARERDQIETLIVRGVDGLMLTGETRDPSAYDLLARRGIRYACTYVHQPDSPHPTIGFDNRRAMHMVVGYLHDLGHQAFAMIAGIADGNDRASERIAGVQEALAYHDLQLASPNLLQRPYSIQSGREALRQLMALPARPSAVVCGNDILAIGALLEAQAMGLRVPDDISITGFDDISLAREIPPGLTTIHAPLRRMGQLAADYLLDPLPTDDAVPHLELPTEMVVRGSTGPRR